MELKNNRRTAALTAGIVLNITGIFLIGVYLWEAYISRIGEPDQSLLFWYIPFLFTGLFALTGGIFSGIMGFAGLKNAKASNLFRTFFLLLLMIIITVPISIIITILSAPFWLWFETSTGIESMGHSGPAEWCYGTVFFLLAAVISLIYLIHTRRKKYKK